MPVTTDAHGGAVTSVSKSILELNFMSDKFAVVTGASSGIGLSLAKELASRGYDLLVCSAGERLLEAAEVTRSYGTNVIAVTADLATREGVNLLWKTIADLGRPVDVACINAGIGVGGQFWETDLKQELTMVELNCSGTVHLAKHAVRHMRQLNSGKILFTSSIAGEMVAPREAVYAATKAFVLSFAHSLRYELRDTGITVTALQPGPTDTDFFHRAGMDGTQVGSEGKKQSAPDDVAKDGLDALFAGKDHVYSHSAETKLEGAVANLVPGSVKASMHEKMAKPLSDK
ncbi:MAG TPA: SDR family NAD(P)-dependent oxidoreductase [Terracidiphilus sp.]|nr:SDR family NAD(P)-dependent oxidoreductase [Terracidiphilus sp.]